jgi:ligand-binding sensor domain-containing protein
MVVGINIISHRKLDYTYIKSDNADPRKIPEGKITSLFRDINNNLWIGIYGRGLYLYNENEKSVKLFPSGNDIINNINQDSLGYLWVSTNLGLVKIDTKNKTYSYWNEVYPNIPIPEDVVSNTFESNNKEFWISTYGSGVYKVSADRKNITNYPASENGLPDNTVYSTIEANGSLWFATNRGLSKFDPETGLFSNYFHNKKDRKTLGINNIRYTFVDSSGNLWVGTYGGGVSRYLKETDNFKTFTSHEGLSSNTIISIIEGMDNSLWVITKSGVDLIPKPYTDVYNLGRDYGLNDIAFSSGVYLEKNGDLLLGVVTEFQGLAL